MTPQEGEAAPEPAEEPDRATSVPVVGIGASAGGLEAFNRLLAHLPADTGLAFVLVQHLAAHRESLLPEILARKTRMRVLSAEDGSALEANCVFVLPADKDITVSGGVLALSARSDTIIPHHPIDHFLRSLAADQKDRAIGVILSGTGSDGSLGIQAVKEEGGITFAQDAESAQQPGMPQSAIATGSVDLVLPPEGIAAELTRMGRHPYLGRAVPFVPASSAEEGGQLRKIFTLLRARFGPDFGQYHPATIERRLHRRMVLTGLGTVSDYAARVLESMDEASALFNDLLIKTTKFFRDPETFEFLRQSILPSILESHSKAGAEQPVRIWVPACATGEEAYSLGMALLEAAPADDSRLAMQLFASDASEAAVNQARKGRYPENISADVSPERLRRFFARTGGLYEVNAAVRKMFVFARQDLLRDPPFSRMDLVCCRNLLTYLGPEAQRRALSALHYALKPGGLLLLGAAEGPGQAPHLFQRVDKRYKVFSKQPAEGRFVLTGPPRHYQPEESPRGVEKPVGSLQAEADRVALLHLSFPSFLINEDLTILQFRGDTSPYIRPAAGKARFNIVDMVREELRPGLRAAILRAKKDDAPAKRTRLRLAGPGGLRYTNVEVLPIRTADSAERLFLVAFQDSAPPAAALQRGRAATKGGKDGGLVLQLKRELAESREELKSVVEDQQAALEALQAANEELESANEELQSNNEELETNKEEIEATNEELVTVNAEMQARNRELADLSRTVGAVFDTVIEPLVILDAALRVRQANRSFYETFAVSSEETVGVALAELGADQWAVPELTQRLEKVFSAQSTIERFEVEADFPRVGYRQMTLNARLIRLANEDAPALLLAMEDTTSKSIVRAQQRIISELSTPVLRVGSRVMVVPIVGLLDAERALQLKQQLLAAIKEHRTKVAVVDITGVAAMDAAVAHSLMQTADAARLLGAKVILTGISRQTAEALSGSEMTSSNVTAVSDLQRGLEEANVLLGFEVITRRELTELRAAMRESQERRDAEAAGEAS